VALLPFLLLLGQPAAGDPLGNWRVRPYLTGDWNGVRTRLASRGIEPYARYSGGFWSNLHGGRDVGTRYEGLAAFGLDLDLERLAAWHGARFHIGWHDYRGGKPSEALVGQFGNNATSGIEAEDAFRFYQIYLEQTLLDERLVVKAGQLALDEDFMVARYAQLFLNASFGDFVSNAADGTFAVYPLATPGLYAEARPGERWRTSVGVYTSNPGEDEGGNIGFDWSISRNAGATIFAEIARRWRPLGLPGTGTVGVSVNTGEVTDYSNGGSEDGAYLVYAMLDQTLLAGRSRDGEPEPRLGGFLRLAHSLQDDRYAVRWHLDGGLQLRLPRGALPGPEHDSVGLAFSRDDFARDFLRSERAQGERVTSSEWVFEATYRAPLTGWLTLQPNLQYYVDPHFSRRNALVLGLRVDVAL
jgi:porin